MCAMYRGRQMKGSNLAVGLQLDAEGLNGGGGWPGLTAYEIPASCFRTLAHIFESAKLGLPYAITPADIEEGGPARGAGSCAPLWDAPPSFPGDDPGAPLTPDAAAQRLLQKSPHWCYLYNSE
jgi:hypothetical protein